MVGEIVVKYVWIMTPIGLIFLGQYGSQSILATFILVPKLNFFWQTHTLTINSTLALKISTYTLATFMCQSEKQLVAVFN